MCRGNDRIESMSYNTGKLALVLNSRLGTKPHLSNFIRHLTNQNPCIMVQEKLNDVHLVPDDDVISSLVITNASGNPTTQPVLNSNSYVQTSLQKRKRNRVIQSSTVNKKKNDLYEMNVEQHCGTVVLEIIQAQDISSTACLLEINDIFDFLKLNSDELIPSRKKTGIFLNNGQFVVKKVTQERGFRYETVVREFATSLYILGGRTAYELVRLNIPAKSNKFVDFVCLDNGIVKINACYQISASSCNQFLALAIKCVRLAYIEKETDYLDRIYFAWITVFIFRLWFVWINDMDKKELDLTYSQVCQSDIFENNECQIKDVNFTASQFLNRINKTSVLQKIKCESNKNNLHFSQHHKLLKTNRNIPNPSDLAKLTITNIEKKVSEAYEYTIKLFSPLKIKQLSPNGQIISISQVSDAISRYLDRFWSDELANVHSLSVKADNESQNNRTSTEDNVTNDSINSEFVTICLKANIFIIQ
ncbi:hypothetical protein I4U23_016004 [Adineta vaga]|nr:hypothetical protein I4U23_016004 [Adineta vaga]